MAGFRGKGDDINRPAGIAAAGSQAVVIIPKMSGVDKLRAAVHEIAPVRDKRPARPVHAHRLADGPQIHFPRLPNLHFAIGRALLIRGLKHREQALHQVARTAQRVVVRLPIKPREARGPHRVVARNPRHCLPHDAQHRGCHAHLAQRCRTNLQLDAQLRPRQ